eukprot:Sspe_Gene.2248::Locus_748_Transcript_1_1_Confidence_1.000_Length_5252::g.2248::m.2248
MPQPCQETDETKCKADDRCEWITSLCNPGAGAKCRERNCQFGDQATCGADRKCLWGLSGCVEQPCAKYDDDEACCNAVDECHATGTPPVCTEKRCPKIGKADCDKDPECMWRGNATGVEKCLDLECPLIDDRCPCDQRTKCFWKPMKQGGQCVAVEYGECPTMDMVVVLDGSEGMGQKYARGHTNGYLAVSELLRDWLKGLPLNKEKAGTASAPLNGGMRVGIVQFAAASGSGSRAAVAPRGQGTGGRLSGDLAELEDDMKWHEANFIGSGERRVSEGLQRAADMLLTSPSDGRRKMVIVLSGGKVEDAEGADVAKAQNSLAGMGGEAFAALLRRDEKAGGGSGADESVKRLASDPKDVRFANLLIDDLAGVLHGLCDPQGQWGRQVVTSAPQPTTGHHLP